MNAQPIVKHAEVSKAELAGCARVKRSWTPFVRLGSIKPTSEIMKKNYSEETYKVWACDNQVYGPIDLRTLTDWVEEGRVLAASWVYLEANKEWRAAKKIDPLTAHFPVGEETAFLQQRAAEGGGMNPQELRLVPVLSSLSNTALAQVIRFGQLLCFQPGEIVIKKGDPGDALFFVLAGGLRARLMVGMDDQTLAQIGVGEVFGEMAMFTQSPRSADVVAEEASRLLRLGTDSFRQLIEENPEAAAPMLFAMARVMADRIKQDNWRFQREKASEFLWR